MYDVTFIWLVGTCIEVENRAIWCYVKKLPLLAYCGSVIDFEKIIIIVILKKNT